jgi:hypothetical protein
MALEERIAALGVSSVPIAGASPDLSHQEAGFALEAGNLGLAAALSAEFRQKAFFWINQGEVYLCEDASGVGWLIGRLADRYRCMPSE